MSTHWQCNACHRVFLTEAEAAGCPCPGHSHARTRVEETLRARFCAAGPENLLTRKDRVEHIAQSMGGLSDSEAVIAWHRLVVNLEELGGAEFPRSPRFDDLLLAIFQAAVRGASTMARAEQIHPIGATRCPVHVRNFDACPICVRMRATKKDHREALG